MPLVPPQHQLPFDNWLAANPDRVQQILRDGGSPYNVWLLENHELARPLDLEDTTPPETKPFKAPRLMTLSQFMDENPPEGDDDGEGDDTPTEEDTAEDEFVHRMTRRRITVRGPKGVDAFESVMKARGWELKFNTMSKMASLNGMEIEQDSIAKLRYFLETGVWLQFGSGKGVSYKLFVANETEVDRWSHELALVHGSFHPIQDYLNGLAPWDGTPRIDGLLGWLLGGTIEDDTPQRDLARIASANIIMMLVNRAMEPGCAWPLMTILWGPQGLGKSAFLELLMPPDSELRYESATFPLTDEELFDFTRNSWLVEFSDPSTKRAESEGAKTFISRQGYTYRHKYARKSTRHPYNFGMVATGNPDGNTVIPPDASGYRRYLSVDCEKQFEYDKLKALMDAAREQIWAEAMQRYNTGEKFKEIPRVLHEIRDAAAGAKAGSEHLEGFTEYVADKLEKDAADTAAGSPVAKDPSAGYAMDTLIEGFLNKNVIDMNTASVGQIVNFRRQNSAQLTACLKLLGMVNRKVTKKKVSRWFKA